jgi:hypothetical protein
MSGTERLFALCTVPFVFLGCLSNSYVVEHGELERLSALQADERAVSVRAVQRIGGDDYPPDGESFAPPPDDANPTVFAGTIVVNSHHHDGAGSPHSGPHPSALPHVTDGSSSTGTTSGHAGYKKGNGDSLTAAAVAAAVVGGAAAAFTAIGSEGARYDGWLAVNPDESLHLQLPDGRVRTVPLSVLSPSDAAATDYAILYEGEEGRFARLRRAPLDRAGFTVTTALHMGGVPQIGGEVATGMGGYLHLGGNIANMVTLGMTATADSGLDAKRSMLIATLAPELQIFPVRYVGFYGGYGWSFRNTDVDGRTRADSGGFFRAGVVGELPLTTRLALQARVGIADYLLPEGGRLLAEGQLGIAIY